MTTREDKRFTAAVAAMQAIAGAIAQNQDDPDLAACRIIRNQPNDVAELAILYADCLIAKLEETAPKKGEGAIELIKKWQAEDENCEHKFVNANAQGWQCTTCGEVLP